MTDADTQAAVDALAHRIRNRDAAIRDGADCADPEPFAAEFITALRGRGWRHTEAKAPRPWQRPGGEGTAPGADYLAAKAQIAAKAARLREDAP